MAAVWENRPNPTLRRAEMWCARFWIEDRDAALFALASGDGKLYRRLRQDEHDWLAALVLVNSLLIENEKGESADV